MNADGRFGMVWYDLVCVCRMQWCPTPDTTSAVIADESSLFLVCLLLRLAVEACRGGGGEGSKASALTTYPTCITLHYVTEVLSGPFLLLPRLAPTFAMQRGKHRERNARWCSLSALLLHTMYFVLGELPVLGRTGDDRRIFIVEPLEREGQGGQFYDYDTLDSIRKKWEGRGEGLRSTVTLHRAQSPFFFAVVFFFCSCLLV